MKILFSAAFLWAVLAMPSFARLGDTLDQAEARYGLPKKPLPPGIVPTLLEGAREVWFEYGGFRIRCAFLPATDGHEYVVREEYRKVWNAEVMKQGGTIDIRDFEREAILKGESGATGWRKSLPGLPASNPEGIGSAVAEVIGLTSAPWIRDDGAKAWLTAGQTMILELPQAGKYEAELRAIKEQRARASVPSF